MASSRANFTFYLTKRETNTWKICLPFFQEILNALMPLGIHILSRGRESDGHLDSDSSAILRNIVLRLTCDTVACLKYWDCWKFVQTAIMDWKTVLQDRVGRTCPAIIMMQQVSLRGLGFCACWYERGEFIHCSDWATGWKIGEL